MKTNNSTAYAGLTTERFTLRPVNAGDCEEIFQLLTDKEVNKYYGRPRARHLQDAVRYIEMLEKNASKGQVFYWGICFKQEPKIIGTICLWNFNQEESEAEIGFELLPAFHGKGIMKEVVKEVIHFSFEVLKLETLTAWTNDINYPSIKILEHNSFTRDIEAEKKIDWTKEADFYRTNEELKKVVTVIYSLKKPTAV